MSGKIKIPNDHMCMAMLQPEHNEWWLCPSTFDASLIKPWLNMIEQSGGTLKTPLQPFAYAGGSLAFADCIKKANQLKGEGFVARAGGYHQMGFQGTVWLRDTPRQWLFMQTASQDQLTTFRCFEGSSVDILDTLARQGWFEDVYPKNSYKGPSFLAHRWDAVFPDEIAFARQCQMLGLKGAEVCRLWLEYKNNVPPLGLPCEGMNLFS